MFVKQSCKVTELLIRYYQSSGFDEKFSFRYYFSTVRYNVDVLTCETFINVDNNIN